MRSLHRVAPETQECKSVRAADDVSNRPSRDANGSSDDGRVAQEEGVCMCVQEGSVRISECVRKDRGRVEARQEQSAIAVGDGTYRARGQLLWFVHESCLRLLLPERLTGLW